MRVLGLFLWFAAPVILAVLVALAQRLGYVLLRRPSPPMFVLLLRGLVVVVGLAAVLAVVAAVRQGH